MHVVKSHFGKQGRMACLQLFFLSCQPCVYSGGSEVVLVEQFFEFLLLSNQTSNQLYPCCICHNGNDQSLFSVFRIVPVAFVLAGVLRFVLSVVNAIQRVDPASRATR